MCYVLSEIVEQFGEITLNRSDKRNALSETLIKDIIEALRDLEIARTRTVILRAEKNVKVWSAGHDVRELPRSKADPLRYSDPLEPFSFNLARQICSLSPCSIAAMKEQANIIADCFPINPEMWEYIQELRRKVYQGCDYDEGINAFLEKRRPQFVGH